MKTEYDSQAHRETTEETLARVRGVLEEGLRNPRNSGDFGVGLRWAAEQINRKSLLVYVPAEDIVAVDGSSVVTPLVKPFTSEPAALPSAEDLDADAAEKAAQTATQTDGGIAVTATKEEPEPATEVEPAPAEVAAAAPAPEAPQVAAEVGPKNGEEPRPTPSVPDATGDDNGSAAPTEEAATADEAPAEAEPSIGGPNI